MALQHPEAVALLVTRPTEIFMRVFWPFITGLNTLGRLVVRAVGLKAPSGHSLVHSEEELKMLVTASQEAGVLEEEEEQMLHRVFGFSDLHGRPGDGAEDGNGGAAASTRHSSISPTRWPAAATRGCRSTARTSTTSSGMLHVTDLFSMVAGGKTPTDLTGVLRDAFTVPETMQAGDLLSEMRTRHTPVAIVIDEFGGTAGLVTFAGLMERIVGEVGPGGAREPDQRAGRWLGPHRRPRARGRRQRAVRPAYRRRGVQHRSAATFSAAWAGGRASAIASTSRSRTLRVEALDGLRVARIFLSKEKEASSLGA